MIPQSMAMVQGNMGRMHVAREGNIPRGIRNSKQTGMTMTEMRLRGLYTRISHGILAPEGCLSIFCAHLGNACTQVRRSSVACKGVTSASVLGRYPSVLPHSVVPRIGYASCSSRGGIGRVTRGVMRPKERLLFWPPIRHFGVASAVVILCSRLASKSFMRARA